MKYGVQLFSLRKYLKDEDSYREVFERVKSLGAEVVQISCTMGSAVGAKTLASVSAEFELPICVTHSPYQRIVNDIDRLAEEHLVFGCKEIGIGMMPKEFRKDDFATLYAFVDSLNVASEKLQKYGLSVAYHNHWFEFDKKDGKRVFDTLIENTQPGVRFIPDVFWIKVGGEDPSEFLKKLDGRVKTLHLKDYKKTLGLPVFRAPGKGTLDFDSIIDTAKNIGVENAVVEIDLSPNPWKSVEDGIEYLERYKK